MGASTLLLEAAQNPGIQVAVMDSPYGDLPEVLKTQLSKHSHLPSWFNPGILSAARWVFGVRTDDLVPIKAARSWGDRPLLLIHGESDSIVPVSQAFELASAAGASCLTMTLPGVEHVQAVRGGPQGLRRADRGVLSRPPEPVSGSARRKAGEAKHALPARDPDCDVRMVEACGTEPPGLADARGGALDGRSGPGAAMGPEWGHVGRLIEEPEPLPVVASLPEIFRVDEQFLDSPGLPCRVVRQRDGRTTLEQSRGKRP